MLLNTFNALEAHANQECLKFISHKRAYEHNLGVSDKQLMSSSVKKHDNITKKKGNAASKKSNESADSENDDNAKSIVLISRFMAVQKSSGSDSCNKFNPIINTNQ